MMSSNTFWRTVFSGLVATFVMTMVAFLQGGFGLPVIDVGYLLKESFNAMHPTDPYTIFWGNAAYNIGGVLLALFWISFLAKYIPGNWFLQGVIYGVCVSIFAGLIVSPLVSRAAGEPFGIFYFDTWTPWLFIFAGLTMHLAYGIVLMLCLKVAGVSAK